MKEFNKAIGKRIGKLRKEHGFSQEQLAKNLGLTRVSVSQIENGERKITAEEITILSKIFNTPSDVLLNLKKDIKLIIEIGKKAVKTQESIRISVPQKNLNKFKEVLLYILKNVGSKPNIGETVIYKLLYFIDFNFYEKYEEQFIGATYIKNHYGPTPTEFKKIIKKMEGKEIIRVKDKYFSYPQTKYLPLREPNLSNLSAKEIKMIDEVLKHFSDMNAKEISDYSHKDVPWLTSEEGEIIDYEKVFYRTPPYSVRKEDTDVVF